MLQLRQCLELYRSLNMGLSLAEEVRLRRWRFGEA
jgi:hypothetical protein